MSDFATCTLDRSTCCAKALEQEGNHKEAGVGRENKGRMVRDEAGMVSRGQTTRGPSAR